MTANQLNDGLWSWKGIYHGWFQLAIGLLVVAILQGIQLRLLRNNACLSTHSGLGRLDTDSQDMLSQGSKGKRQLVTLPYACRRYTITVQRWYRCRCLWGSRLHRRSRLANGVSVTSA